MSLPMKKKVSAYTDATPTLTDRVLGLSTTIVSNFTFQSIYNLFKTSYDSVYATITSLNSAINSLETYADNAANSAETNAVSTANSYTDGVAATKQDIFTYEGADSGTTAVTINDYKSGVAEFTQVITRKTTQSFRINSAAIGASSKVIPVLVYGGAGYPVILSQKVASGRVDFLVANIAVDGGSGADTDSNILIEYQIIG